MAGKIDNLVPTTALTEEERRAMARRAGNASGKARRQKRTLRELAEIIGSMPTKNPKTIAIMEKPSAPSIAPLIVCRIVSQYGTA